jgi:hypothetical protein
MEAKDVERVVPPQYEGARKDIEQVGVSEDPNDALRLFATARKRLLDINGWDQLCGKLTSTFRLTDENGKPLSRTAQKGDYFKIDLPGPGTMEGQGYDWVCIESIEDFSDPNGTKESIVITVRPAPSPERKGENVAHFFDQRATSSFVVSREGTKVKAAVYGRNELPNTSTTQPVDKVRNAVAAVSAILGFSDIQWKNLVKGLLHT